MASRKLQLTAQMPRVAFTGSYMHVTKWKNKAFRNSIYFGHVGLRSKISIHGLLIFIAHAQVQHLLHMYIPPWELNVQILTQLLLLALEDITFFFVYVFENILFPVKKQPDMYLHVSSNMQAASPLYYFLRSEDKELALTNTHAQGELLSSRCKAG